MTQLSGGVFDSPQISWSLGLMAVGAMIAVTAGAMYILVAAGTVFLGRRSDVPDIGYVDASSVTPADPNAVRHAPKGFEAPGTMMLATVFLLLFMLLYAQSWFQLSKVTWIIR